MIWIISKKLLKIMRTKVDRTLDKIEVRYDEKRWMLLRRKRNVARRILEGFNEYGVYAIVHGSIARGDVKKDSDIDIFIPYLIPSYKVEFLIKELGYEIDSKYIVQATPNTCIKALYELVHEENLTISHPLIQMSNREIEFYKFGGMLDLKGLIEDIRVPGVNKALKFIEPTNFGHIEYSIIGIENIVAKKLRISIDTVMERVRVLTRRDEIGRTGLFIKIKLSPNENVEEAFKRIIDTNQYVRRLLKRRGMY